ncbi:hypothetical protein HK104_008460 [Borealophlyctis nickersoniae]|nr:hypothetical protein HK104_008460 [Borealophlyctis nickersoniae]
MRSTILLLALASLASAQQTVYSLDPPPTCADPCTASSKPQMNVTSTGGQSHWELATNDFACGSGFLTTAQPCLNCITKSDDLYNRIAAGCKESQGGTVRGTSGILLTQYVDLRWTRFNADGSVNATGVRKANETVQTGSVSSTVSGVPTPTGEAGNNTGAGAGNNGAGAVGVGWAAAVVGMVAAVVL